METTASRTDEGELRYRIRCIEMLGHPFRGGRRWVRALVLAAFPETRFGAFEAHYAPQLAGVPRFQRAVEDGLERLPPFRPLLSYNFAVARR